MTSEHVIEIADGIAILRALDHVGGRPFDWAELDAPVVDRGPHAIFLHAVAEVEDAADAAASNRLLERERALRPTIRRDPAQGSVNL